MNAWCLAKRTSERRSTGIGRKSGSSAAASAATAQPLLLRDNAVTISPPRAAGRSALAVPLGPVSRAISQFGGTPRYADVRELAALGRLVQRSDSTSRDADLMMAAPAPNPRGHFMKLLRPSRLRAQPRAATRR